MKFTYIYLLVISFVLVQCSPKTTKSINVPVQESMTKVDQAWRSSVPTAAPARKLDMGEYSVNELENGLTVIVVENHKLPRVSYSLSLQNDPVLEGDQVGMIGFAGDLLGRGTSNRTKAQIDQETDFIGASFSTSGGGMFGSALTKHQDKLLDVMTDVLYNPIFPQEEFDKIIKQALTGIEASKTDPNAIAGNIAAAVNYGANHPYGEITTAETINSISLEDCKNYYKTYFKPNNTYLTIVGDITAEEAMMKAKKYFGKWSKGQIPTAKYKKPIRPNGTKVAIGNKDGAVQSVINITYPVNNTPGNPDELTNSIMNQILGGAGFASRLMQNLREDKAYTYGAGSSLSSDKLIGRFNASASVRTEVTDSAIVQFLYEMDKIASEPVSEDDLQLAKNIRAGSFARSLESPQTLARFARTIKKYNLPQDHYETFLERLEAITVDQIMASAKKFITPNNANIVVVGNKDEIKDKLLQFDADGEIDYYDAFGNKMEQIQIALPTDINAEVVINDYINALGGEAKLKALKTLELSYDMNMMGQAVTISQTYAQPENFYMKVGNGQMVFQEMKYNGKKAASGGMQGSQTATEGPLFEQAKSQANMFPQTLYGNEGYMLELKGIDKVDEESCYKLSVTDPSGNKTTEFYSVKSALIMRQVSSQEGPGGQAITITTDYGDYKDVDGYPFPHKIKTSGAMPMPMEMTASSIKVNPEIDSSIFNIE